MNQASPNPPPHPGAPAPAGVDDLPGRAEAELAGLDQLSTHDQVAGYDRIHDSLVQALTRTADSTGQPGGPGQPGGQGQPGGRPGQPGGRPGPGRPGA